MLTPGGLPWLVRHEIRLALRSRGPRRRSMVGVVAILLLVLLVPTVIGVTLALGLQDIPDRPAGVLGTASVVIAGLVLLMTSTASLSVLRTFHDRADLDLLLAAPIPASRILAAKSVAVYATVALPMLVVTTPFVIASAVLGHPGWLGALVMIVVAAVLGTSLAFAIARGLFRSLGVRRARTIMQIGSAVFGGSVFLVSQVHNFAPQQSTPVFRMLARTPPAPLDWPARAAFGDPLPLIAMILLAAGAAALAARIAAHNFRDATTGPATSDAPDQVSQRRPRPFRSGLRRIIVAKELRLLARDPELLSQLALRLVYMVPVIGLIFTGETHGVFPGSRIAASCTLFAGMAASSLAWLTICAEDAPDLVEAAPIEAGTLRRAKLIAACLPPMALVLLLSVAILPYSPRAALIGLGMSGIAALTAALLQLWFGKPQPRSAFKQRQRGSLLVSIGEFALAGAWSAAASALVRGSIWAAVPLVIAAAIMGGALNARPRP